MFKTVLGILGVIAAWLVIGLILSKTVPKMPSSKPWRFVILFAFWIPSTFAINRVYVSLLGWHKMGWIGASIVALFCATMSFFQSLQPDKSNTS